MENRYVVGYAVGAKEQLDLLLAEQRMRGGERAVGLLIEKLDRAFDTLSVFLYYGAASNQGRLTDLGYRKVVLHPFVLLYTVHERSREVAIRGVFHHRQNYEEEL